MYDKLKFIEEKYDELSNTISDPEIIADQNRWRELMKEHSNLEPIVAKFKEYRDVLIGIDDSREMMQVEDDKDFVDMIKAELSDLEEKKAELEEELKIMLLPQDPNDEKNVIVEIRGAAGGEEAALFAGDLYRMYTRYAERMNWKTEVLSSNPTDIGGYKEVIFEITGKGAFSRLKYESGAHRVQRVPTTEAGGRVHTSTSTVVVMPEADDLDFQLDLNDVRIDVYRSSGHGGQSVNTTDSAVRVTHIPTNTVVTCQDEKSQLKNKDKALKILKTKLLDAETEKMNAEIASERKSKVGTGDRSERIRTYNFPQGRVTDHRIGFTLYRLEAFLDGDLDEMIDNLITTDQAERLKNNE